MASLNNVVTINLKKLFSGICFFIFIFFFTLYQQLPVPQGRQHKSKTTGNGSGCQVAFFEPTLSRRVGHIEQASGVAYHVPSLSKQRNEGSKWCDCFLIILLLIITTRTRSWVCKASNLFHLTIPFLTH